MQVDRLVNHEITALNTSAWSRPGGERSSILMQPASRLSTQPNQHSRRGSTANWPVIDKGGGACGNQGASIRSSLVSNLHTIGLQAFHERIGCRNDRVNR